jgi:hypothetical protein
MGKMTIVIGDSTAKSIAGLKHLQANLSAINGRKFTVEETLAALPSLEIAAKLERVLSERFGKDWRN